MGLLLVRPLWTLDVLTFLNRCQREVHDYWSATRYAGLPLHVVQVLEKATLEEFADAYNTSDRHSSLFWKMTSGI